MRKQSLLLLPFLFILVMLIYGVLYSPWLVGGRDVAAIEQDWKHVEHYGKPREQCQIDPAAFQLFVGVLKSADLWQKNRNSAIQLEVTFIKDWNRLVQKNQELVAASLDRFVVLFRQEMESQLVLSGTRHLAQWIHGKTPISLTIKEGMLTDLLRDYPSLKAYLSILSTQKNNRAKSDFEGFAKKVFDCGKFSDAIFAMDILQLIRSDVHPTNEQILGIIAREQILLDNALDSAYPKSDYYIHFHRTTPLNSHLKIPPFIRSMRRDKLLWKDISAQHFKKIHEQRQSPQFLQLLSTIEEEEVPFQSITLATLKIEYSMLVNKIRESK